METAISQFIFRERGELGLNPEESRPKPVMNAHSSFVYQSCEVGPSVRTNVTTACSAQFRREDDVKLRTMGRIRANQERCR